MMERYISFFLLLLVLSSCNTSGDSSSQDSLRVSAASSLTMVMKEIKQQYEKEHPDQNITIQYASSGTLAYQLLQGAPTDLYISASERWMEKVIQEGLIRPENVQPLLKNRLVLASHQRNGFKIENLSDEGVGQFSMGDPDSVPVGAYTRQVLEYRGIWDKVQNKAVYGKSVRQVGSYIQSQNVEVGFVYQSDVQALDGVQTNEIVPEEYHEPIRYPLGIVKEAHNNPLVQDFIQYLESAQAKEIFQSYGFVPVK